MAFAPSTAARLGAVRNVVVMVLRLISLARASAPNTIGKIVAMFMLLVSAMADQDSWSIGTWNSRTTSLSVASLIRLVITADQPQAQPRASRIAGISSAHHSRVVRILRNSALISMPISPDLRTRRDPAAGSPAAASPEPG